MQGVMDDPTVLRASFKTDSSSSNRSICRESHDHLTRLMSPDPMDNDTDDKERKNTVMVECLELLRECLSMLADRQRGAKQREERHLEERALREGQYPCDEYDMLSYDEDFKFEWL